MPLAWAIRITSLIGTMVPSAFDIWVMATILVRGGQQLLEFLDEEVAVVVDRRPFDHGAAAFAMEMPGHDIGMMLEDREHDLVALADHHAAEGLRHQVDGLGGIAGEDDLVLGRRVDEPADTFARILESLGRGIGEIVQAAMDIGIVLVHRLAHALEHRLGLLGGSRIVEIDQRLAVDLARQDREVAADGLDVVGGPDLR